MSSDALSPVSTLCLAILHNGEATGYEIKKESVEGDYRYFIDASYGSIYPALSRLAAEGYVTQREEAQAGRPARKVYAITDSGREALIRSLSTSPGPDVFRSRFLLVAKLAAELPPDVLASAVGERIRHLQEEIAHLKEIVEEHPDDAGVAWIVNYGTRCMGASLAYLDERGDDLVALARQDVAEPAQ